MMSRQRIILWIIVIAFACADVCVAQETCYPPGGVAGIVVATIIVTFVVGGLGVALAWRRWTRQTGNQNANHNQHQKPQQKSEGDFAFDNPYFRDQEGSNADDAEKNKARSSMNKNSIRSSKLSEYSAKAKKPKNGKGHFMFGGGKKHRAYDDSCLAVEPERTVVSLRGHDFTGLGFNICGNMRDGIMVKDVLHRGPASESGLIKAGDKILNVTVSFSNIVYEDALTILSYASPYDVQLEIERIPDKSRNTPTTSKKLGSCSFNNSGQKLFHPLYRSQSIDDLTQIDRDTFPSHGIGPRRSQSIGVAAHKLAAHFKSSDSKLEDKDRSPMSLVLSTTGSLNEKMLANVMSDGNIHKNGLQWEKRFEDTLESEDSSNLGDKRIANNGTKSTNVTPMSNDKAALPNKDSTARKSTENLESSKNYKQKNSKYLDSPYNNEKLEIHKSSIEKNEIDGSVTVQIHQPERMSGRRSKTTTQAALWQLDQSIKDDDSSLSNLDSPRYAQRSVLKRDNLPNSPIDRFSQREEGNDSDVSRDSLEISSDRTGKQRLNSQNEIKLASETHNNSLPTSAINKQFHVDRKPGINGKNSGRLLDNSERVYANNVINNSMIAVNSPGSAEQRLSRDKTSHADIKPENIHHENEMHYSNHREAVSHESAHRNHMNSINNTPKSSTSDNFSQNYTKTTRITVNGDSTEPKSKFVQNSVARSNSPSDYKPYQRSDSEVRSNENKTKQSPLHQQAFVKKSANPAGMFTQINPFQLPSKQKNSNFKGWIGREDSNRDSSNDLLQSSGNYVSNSDVASQQNRRSNALPETNSYNQRMGDRTKTVIMSSYENSPYGSINNSQNSNFKHH